MIDFVLWKNLLWNEIKKYRQILPRKNVTQK